MEQMIEELTVRISYQLEGVLQGVGFRPAIFRLASEFYLGGSVQNQSGAVKLELEGTPLQIGEFITSFYLRLPPVARIDDIEVLSKKKISVSDIHGFKIINSEIDNEKKGAVVIPADIAMCRECEREIMNCEDRRYGYPFTTCTDCGPRYTVVNDMPYDRERTTLSHFPLCDKCKDEYESAGERRFHAESIACPECGPQLKLKDANGKTITEDACEALRMVRAKIANGAVVAVRGIGGYLLVCDAMKEETTAKLRERKKRSAKPFAVMFRNPETVFDYCHFKADAVKLLFSQEAPIVVLPMREEAWEHNLIVPDGDTVGAMIPYSPLHKLLFEPLKGDDTAPFKALIMTSGNRGGEPICIGNEEAVEELVGIADFFLTHNREINLRNDDSLCAFQLGEPQVWRRARGYAPQAIPLIKRKDISEAVRSAAAVLDAPIKKRQVPHHNHPEMPIIMAFGADLKNSVAIAYENEVVVSQHLGDLENPVALKGMEDVVDYLPKFLNKIPEIIAVDMHPDMQCTRVGKKLAESLKVPFHEIQHHHAHAASCMTEHFLDEAIALVFDGTGLGPDGNIWGSEAFFVDNRFNFNRIATFAPSRLPGGDAAVHQPARQLVARLYEAGVDISNSLLERLNLSREEVSVWIAQIEKGVNAHLTHAAGRLFDAVSTMLGAAAEVLTYEGQAPIALEGVANLAKERNADLFPFDEKVTDGLLEIDWSPAFRDKIKYYNKQHNNDKQQMAEDAYAFHRSVAKAAIRMIEATRERYDCDDIVLSGGVFMNCLLTSMIAEELENMQLNLYIHRNIPPNDGGISFGQVAIVRKQIRKNNEKN